MNKKNNQNILKIFALIGLISISLISNSQNINVLKNSTIGQYQKPGAPIDLTYSSTIVPNVGDIIEVTLTFSGSLKSNNKIKVSVVPDKSLELYNFTNNVVFDMSIPNTKPKIDLSIYSSQLGLVYLNIFVEYYLDNKKTSNRVFSVPIKTGINSKPILQKSGFTHRDSSGNLLIIQEAETVIQ